MAPRPCVLGESLPPPGAVLRAGLSCSDERGASVRPGVSRPPSESVPEVVRTGQGGPAGPGGREQVVYFLQNFAS